MQIQIPVSYKCFIEILMLLKVLQNVKEPVVSTMTDLEIAASQKINFAYFLKFLFKIWI